MKQLLLFLLLPFLGNMAIAQDASQQMVNVLYFPDNGGAAYVKDMNIDNSDPNQTLINVSGVVGTENSISIKLDPASCITLPGTYISTSSGGDGTQCITCRGKTGTCATICKMPLTNIQNSVALGDLQGSIIYTDVAGYTTDQDGNANGASGKGDMSMVATGTPFDPNQMPRPGVLGIYTSIDSFGNTYCVQCIRGPGWCIMYAASGTPTNHNDWNW